jgi:glycosyltransferase involved in cell wall biosynthesis
MKPLFSIIIPIYKTEKYLDECVQSVLSQSFVDYECILVDDGSPDNCPSLCDDYSKNNTRIKVIHKENGGLSDARNAGILQATGKYIVFLDSDDKLMDNDTLKNLFEVIQKYETDVIINVNNTEFTDNGEISLLNRYSKDIIFDYPNIIVECLYKTDMYLAGCFFVVGKDYLIKNNLFFKENILHEDEHWMPRVLFKTQKIAVNHSPFYAYRVARDGSIMSKVYVKRLFDLLDIINDLLVWSKEENNYTKEGCAFMRERAKIIYDRVYQLSDAVRLQDKKAYRIICKKLNDILIILPNNYKGRRLLVSNIIGSYNTEILYRLYIRIKNRLKLQSPLQNSKNKIN